MLVFGKFVHVLDVWFYTKTCKQTNMLSSFVNISHQMHLLILFYLRVLGVSYPLSLLVYAFPQIYFSALVLLLFVGFIIQKMISQSNNLLNSCVFLPCIFSYFSDNARPYAFWDFMEYNLMLLITINIHWYYFYTLMMI